MMLQISLLAWPNIPQLKLGDIQEYYLSDIPQFLKSTSTVMSFRFKIKSRWERVSGLEEGKYFFVPEDTQKKTKEKIPK